jgi:cytoskeletal protein CcmA (bactofilin family)
MFKRSEESEWSRFSKAFTGREKDEKAEANGESTPEAATPEGEPGGFAEAPSAVVSPTARPPLADTNLSIARPGANAVPHPVFSVDDVESTIGEHTFFDGTYRSENSVRIRGTAQGEIECAKAVFIDENARVSAKVTAASITVAGEVDGELTCSGRVEIQPSGRVTGTINAGTLVMQEGAFFDGNLRMKQGVPQITGGVKSEEARAKS